MGLVFDNSYSHKIKHRTGLIVWLHNTRDQFKLRKFGDIIYFSRKNKYVVIYTNADEANNVLKELEKKNFVKKVEITRHDKLNFSPEYQENLMKDLKLKAEEILTENEDFGS